MSQSSAQPETNEAATEPGAQRVAEVYAKALIAAAEKSGATAAALEELSAIDSEVLERYPRLTALFGSGFVSAEDKVKIVDRTFAGRVSALVLNFLRVLAEHERLELLRDIVRAARKQYDEMRGLLRVEVTTASPLTDELAAKIQQQLRGMFGGEPVLVPKIKPELIGGVVLRVGDAVYDGSVAARLADIRGRIINRSVHEIQSRRDRFSHPAGN
ncbi:MAG TPA: ATP synthase F1 subunit delta [Pirellulales bacterium]|nr:ATP synthase F1 subunit delta [Pirellulales bacterium]